MRVSLEMISLINLLKCRDSFVGLTVCQNIPFLSLRDSCHNLRECVSHSKSFRMSTCLEANDDRPEEARVARPSAILVDASIIEKSSVVNVVDVHHL